MGAVEFLKHGLPLETEFPYAGSDKHCPYDSSEISEGWTGKIIAAPYIGSSLQFSRGLRNGGFAADGSKVQKMMAAMAEWKAPLVVTVAAYSISGSGVYDSCSAINSGGDHMVAIVGWDLLDGKRIAHVWNSWGQTHGDKGVSRILWECGSGRLNRGLGQSARIVQYKPACVPPNAAQPYLHEIHAGESVSIGAAQTEDVHCNWTPTEGLASPTSCVTNASPAVSTEYHLTAENACGTSSSMTLVDVWPTVGSKRKIIHTPFGDVTDRR